MRTLVAIDCVRDVGADVQLIANKQLVETLKPAAALLVQCSRTAYCSQRLASFLRHALIAARRLPS